MPKRKDPNIPINVASVITPWPGKTALEVEQLITYPVERAIAENKTIRALSTREWGLKSISLPNVSIVQIRLSDAVSGKDKLQQFNDINLKLQAISESLPPGAGPIKFNSGFSDTASLLLEVVSPKESEVELSLRARDISKAIILARKTADPGVSRVSLVFVLPRKVNTQAVTPVLGAFIQDLHDLHPGWNIQPLKGPGFVGVDFPAPKGVDDAGIIALSNNFLNQRLGLYQFHPDVWNPVVIRQTASTQEQLSKAGGDKYSYRELDDFSDLIARNLSMAAEVSKVNRSGVLPEQITLAYSQVQLASYALQPQQIENALNARNTPYTGGSIQVNGMGLNIEPSGQFDAVDEIADVVIARNSDGLLVYLRDIAEIHRGYQFPPRLLNYYSWQDKQTGQWQRSRAVSIALFMREGDQLGNFAISVDAILEKLETQLPDDLMIVRVSDQPEQVVESTELFTTALIEAIVMVALIALVGFREWRSALVMLIAIPLTMAMTFGMISALGIDVQQVSIVALIIALGLLVDDPVVACDAIKRELERGHVALISAWLGPTKLANAIMFATLTNVAAYLPLLLLTGDIGHFLYSLPIVMTCALVASRIVSMTFIPLLGYYLLQQNSIAEASIQQRRSQGFTGWYFRIGKAAINHRKKVLIASLLILVSGGVIKSHLVTSFFPYDVQYLSYADVWLRNNASLQDTQKTANKAVQVIQQVAQEYGKQHPDKNGNPAQYLQSVSINLGGSGPKFWFSVISQIQQLNYAQLVIRVNDKDVTPELISLWQQALSTQVPGAAINVKQLQTQPVEYPVAIRLSSRATIDGAQAPDNTRTLRKLAEQVKIILRDVDIAERINDDWGDQDFTVTLNVLPDLANLAGVTNYDIAYSSALAFNGVNMSALRVGDKQIPVVTTLRHRERAQLSDLNNLYVYASENDNKVPLAAVTDIAYKMRTSKIIRTGEFRAISVFAYPVPGHYPSQIMQQIRDDLKSFEKNLPPGYKMEITGSEANASNGNSQLMGVLLICIGLIYITLVVQFKDAVKPLLVFVAVPYGVCGAFFALAVMNSTFGFMAFLGIIALVGVIVSHIIVLFDFVEDARERGESLQDSLLDAGIVRLRPVLITVGATIMALIPLAIHGGPLWQPLCYAQIGGLTFATFVTLLLVPVYYSVFVLDLKIVQWQNIE